MYRRAWRSPHNAITAGLGRATADVLGIVVRRCPARRNALCNLLGSSRCRLLLGHGRGRRFGLRLPGRRQLAEPIVLEAFVEQGLGTDQFDFDTGVLECARLRRASDNHIIGQRRSKLPSMSRNSVTW